LAAVPCVVLLSEVLYMLVVELLYFSGVF